MWLISRFLSLYSLLPQDKHSICSIKSPVNFYFNDSFVKSVHKSHEIDFNKFLAALKTSLVFRTTSDPLQNMELRKMSLKVFIFKSKLHYVRSTQGICILLMKCQEYPKFYKINLILALSMLISARNAKICNIPEVTCAAPPMGSIEGVTHLPQESCLFCKIP